MASDRFVYWRKTVPTVAQLQTLFEDYFGDFAENIVFADSRFWVMLKSKGSFACRRQEHVHVSARNFAEYMTNEGDQRAVEIFVHDVTDDVPQCIDIITRHADEFTNDLAHGLMRLCARLWDGTLDVDQINYMRAEARRVEGPEDLDASWEAAERLIRELRAQQWDHKAIDLLRQMVKDREVP